MFSMKNIESLGSRQCQHSQRDGNHCTSQSFRIDSWSRYRILGLHSGRKTLCLLLFSIVLSLLSLRWLFLHSLFWSFSLLLLLLLTSLWGISLILLLLLLLILVVIKLCRGKIPEGLAPPCHHEYFHCHRYLPEDQKTPPPWVSLSGTNSMGSCNCGPFGLLPYIDYIYHWTHSQLPCGPLPIWYNSSMPHYQMGVRYMSNSCAGIGWESDVGFSQFSRSKAGYELTLSSLKFRIHRVRVKIKTRISFNFCD